MSGFTITTGGGEDAGVLAWNANRCLDVWWQYCGHQRSQSCTYAQDDLGRIHTAACTGLSETFHQAVYNGAGLGFYGHADRLGNIRVDTTPSQAIPE